MVAIEHFYRINRASCANVEELRVPLEGEIECEETTFGVDRPGGKPGWNGENKIVVFGLVKSNGQVRVSPLHNRSGKRIIVLIRDHTIAGSLCYTDDCRAHAWLRTFGSTYEFARTRTAATRGADT